MAPPDLIPLTWTGFARDFFQTYCVSCHFPAGEASLQDFNQYAVVQAYSATIRCGVAPDTGRLLPGCTGSPAPTQFPIGTGPKPTDAERLQVVAWIDAGAPL
jgi:hypothetical protein